MEFANGFQVPADVDTTFATLTDLEGVADCLPGATLESMEGDTYTGTVKVKVGPVQMTYRGTARLVEADPVAKRCRIEASGTEARGTGGGHGRRRGPRSSTPSPSDSRRCSRATSGDRRLSPRPGHPMPE